MIFILYFYCQINLGHLDLTNRNWDKIVMRLELSLEDDE